MAMLTRADIGAAMSLILRDRMVNQFRSDAVLLHLLAVEPGRGDALVWNPKFSGRTAGGAYLEGADMVDADFDAHDRARATLQWAEYRAGAKVSGLAMAVAETGYAGPELQGGDLFDEELVDAVDKVAMDLATDMYSGDPGAAPVELAGAAIAVDGTAGIFAGLNSATHPDWLAAENSIASNALSFEQIRSKLLRPVKDATGRNPDFITGSGALFDQVVGLFDDNSEVVTQVVTRGALIDLQKAAGARAIMLDGVPIIEDRHATANTLYAWTADHVKLVQLPAKRPQRDPTRVVEAVKALTGVDVTVSDVERQYRRPGVIVPTIEWLAQTGDAYKAMVKVYAQLKWRTRNGHAKLTLV